MADGSTEIGIVPLTAVGIEPPGNLPALMALVAAYPYDIKAGQGILQVGGKVVRTEIHIVVAEHQHGAWR